ncbi:DNA polymerase III subunit delta' [Streptococcus caprae]|uniref:DNA polymerase III subunit delta n=1 Tax=Streptococcus caprae TaxID=1640501 RepID=A0ABV8CT35_9STRE
MELKELQPQLFPTFQQILSEGRMSHAYLFSGDFASFEMAIYLAQSRFCEEQSEGQPCGQCRSCRLIAEQEFADVQVVEPQGTIIKTETIRELTRDFSRSGYEGNAQVFIIREAHKMHTNAANSLLKFMEEPQSEVYLILLTSDETKVLPTIKSRCQVFHFPKNRDFLVQYLQGQGALKTQAMILAELATSPESADQLFKDQKVQDLIGVGQTFVQVLLKSKEQAYLEVARLANQANEKKDQDRLFQILTIQLSNIESPTLKTTLLSQLHEARLMWQANVSFQNAMEYMVLK